MGRTYEALSHNRVVRERRALDEGAIPPTVFLTPSHATPVAKAPVEVVREHPPETATPITALADDLSHDDNSVPFIEVGGPRGSKPLYGPLVADTPIPNPRPLRLEPLSAPAPALIELPANGTVTFFPIPEQQPLDPARVAAELVAFHRPDHAVSVQYRRVLAGLAGQHPGVGCPLLVFTTVGHTIEAATAILNLAVTRAREESKRILVIEANHQQPLLAGRLGINAQPGLRELLQREIPMGVALHATAQSHLFALPPGNPDFPVSHEAEARLPGAVEQLRRRFDWLLVNGPEWGSGGAAEWAALGDAAYLVVPRDQWDKPEVEAAHEGIIKAGGKLRGYLALG